MIASVEDLRAFHIPGRTYSVAAIEEIRRADPNPVVGAEDLKVIRYVLALPLEQGDPCVLDLAMRVRDIELTHAAHRLVLAERAEAAIFGTRFTEDPGDRFSRAWCAKVVLDRHDAHRDEWTAHAERIVGILEGTLDPYAITPREKALGF